MNSNTPMLTLSTPLCFLSPADELTIGDLSEGVQIFGATGGGKTSGSGNFLAQTFLKSGLGGLVLTVKVDERQTWEKLAKETGRELLIFSPDNPWRFNFLDYEMKKSADRVQVENLVELFLVVLELDKQGEKAKNDSYWKNTLKQLLRNTIDLLRLSKGNLSVLDLYKIVTSAPQSLADVDLDFLQVNGEGEGGNGGANNSKSKKPSKAERWLNASFCGECLLESFVKKEAGDLSDEEIGDLEIVQYYWTKEFPTLADKTRSVIVSSFTSLADVFLRGAMRELFTTTTNIVPEFTHKGAIIILDLPVHKYKKVGRYAQALFKYLWQNSIQERKVKEDSKPVFLWVDEAQFFINSHDVEFQTTARSSRALTVYLSQNLPKYIATLGENLTYSLLGNLQTKIFHQNGDPKTNEYASQMIGKTWQDKITTNLNQKESYEAFDTENKKDPVSGSSFSDSLEFQVIPNEFTALKKGGDRGKQIVEAFVFQGGRIWEVNGLNVLRVKFRQD